MTLVIGCVCSEFVALASDQMITWSVRKNNRVALTYNNVAIKTTIFAGRYLIGFSGVADLGGNTESWLLQKLSGYLHENPTKWSSTLQSDLARQITHQRLTGQDARLLVLIVGYSRSSAVADVEGVLRVISNVRDPGRLKASIGNPTQFSISSPGIKFDDPACEIWAIGNTPTQGQLLATARDIRRYVRNFPGHHFGVVRLLGHAIARRSAELRAQGVGTSINVTIMPRSSAGIEGFQMPLVGISADPLNATVSYELNSSDRAPGNTLTSQGVNLVTSDLIIQAPAVALGSLEPLGPRVPLKP